MYGRGGAHFTIFSSTLKKKDYHPIIIAIFQISENYYICINNDRIINKLNLYMSLLASIFAASCPLINYGLISWPTFSILTILTVVGLWKVFIKAGQPGWAAIVPIYNTLILLKIACRPWWWLLLMFIPGVNFIISIFVMIDIAKAFRKGTGFILGLIFLSPIFIMILGFGKSRHISDDRSIR